MFNKLMLPESFRPYFSKYPQGYTVMEALIDWVNQVNHMSDSLNQIDLKLEDFVSQYDLNLQSTITGILSDWQASGALDVIISEALDTQVNTLSADLTLYKAAQQAMLIDYPVDFAAFGGVGDGSTDNSLQWKAFLQQGGNLTVSPGLYMIRADHYPIAEHTHLKFSPGARVKLMSHDATHYAMIQCLEVEDVTIENAVLDGSRLWNMATTGEWGHGIDILNSQHVTIISPEITDTWGDGVYIGHAYSAAQTAVTEDITVVNANIRGCSRNGISVCGGKGIRIQSPRISDITRTAPTAGIDIEPEGGSGGVAPVLDDVHITNPTIINCGPGLGVYLSQLPGGSNIGVTVDSPKIIDCVTPLSFGKREPGVTGQLTFNNVTVQKAKEGVIYSWDYAAEGTPAIVVNGITVDRFNVSGSTNDYQNHFLTVFSAPSMAAYDCGNISIHSPLIEDSSNQYLKFVFAYLVDSPTYKVKRVRITNPAFKTSKAVTNFTRNNPDIKFSDGLEEMYSRMNYYQEAISNTLANYCTNASASANFEFTSIDTYIPLGFTVTFSLRKSWNLKFKPTTFIQGLTTAGQSISAASTGDTLTLKFIGDRWLVVNKQGVWTAGA